MNSGGLGGHSLEEEMLTTPTTSYQRLTRKHKHQIYELNRHIIEKNYDIEVQNATIRQYNTNVIKMK